jgi:hypothetical protein
VFRDVSVFVGGGSNLIGIEFSAFVGTDGKWDVATDVFEINFGVVCVNLVSIAFTCLVKAIGASKHTVRAGGDFSVIADAILLEKTIDECGGRVFAFQWKSPHFAGCGINDQEVTSLTSPSFNDVLAFGGSIGDHVRDVVWSTYETKVHVVRCSGFVIFRRDGGSSI